MKHRPLPITLLASFLLAAPIVILIYLLCGNDWNIISSAEQISMHMLLLAVASYVVGIGIWKVRPWGFYSLIGLTLGVVAYNIYEYYIAPETLSHLNLLLIVGFAIAVYFITREHVTAPYFNPRVRWWERADRLDVNLQGEFQIKDKKVRYPILDISSTGCFVAFKDIVNPDDLIPMHITLLDFDFSVVLRVIRHSENPEGYGLMYVDMDRKQQNEIKKIMNYLYKSSEKTRD